MLDFLERETGVEPATSSLGSWHSGRKAMGRCLRGRSKTKLEVGMAKALAELRQSPYHQELGRKMCAAFVAQQQGITLNTAMKKVPTPVGDLWLMIAEYAERAVAKAIDLQFPCEGSPNLRDCSCKWRHLMESRTTTRLLTVDEVSNWLAVSPSWVRDHATGRRRPNLPHIKLGKSLRFDEKRVAEWLNALRRSGRSA